MLYVVIMAGGTGTRFWPASRVARPKQFLSFGAGRPLIEETLHRLSGLVPPERILVMTNAEYVGLASEIVPEIPAENFVGEPACRDTSACIGLAAVILRRRDPDAVMAVVPSDHLIRPAELFTATLDAAGGFVKTHKETLVTFGIEPTVPATGYGYIKTGEEIAVRDGIAFSRAERFHEKPTPEKAKEFLKEGGFCWNSGIFVWRADAILGCIEEFLPDLYTGIDLLSDKVGTAQFSDALQKIYPGLPKISIDYGVMEKAPDKAVAAVKYFWDDVGSWAALERILEPDNDGNRVHGDFEGEKSSNLIVSATGGIVAALGVKDLIIVHTPDATLVCRKEDAEKVKKIVERLGDEYR